MKHWQHFELQQPIVMQHGDDRPLKRTIEVGESSTAKYQKVTISHPSHTKIHYKWK